jgi:Gamma tubulin complex component C-terminal/Gamma tubulin complex component N-terminal
MSDVTTDYLTPPSALDANPCRDDTATVLSARARALLVQLCGPNGAPRAEAALQRQHSTGQPRASLGAALVELRADGRAREADALEILAAAVPPAATNLLLHCRRRRLPPPQPPLAPPTGNGDRPDAFLVGGLPTFGRKDQLLTLSPQRPQQKRNHEHVQRPQGQGQRPMSQQQEILLAPHAKQARAYRTEPVPRAIFNCLVQEKEQAAARIAYQGLGIPVDRTSLDEEAESQDQNSAPAFPDCIGAGARRRMQLHSPNPVCDLEQSKPAALPVNPLPRGPSARTSKAPRRVRDRRKSPWLLAAARDPRKTPAARHAATSETPREELLRALDPELRHAFRIALEKIDAHPQRRLSLQVLSILLGAASMLLPDVATAPPSLADAPSAQLPPLANEICLCLDGVAFLARACASLKERARLLLHHAFLEKALDGAGEGVREDDFMAIPPQQDAILRRAALCGRLYRSLALFVDVYSSGELGSVLQSAALFIGSVLDQYADLLLQMLDQDAWTSGPRGHCPVTPWSLLIDAERFIDDLETIADVVADIEQTRGSARDVLDVLYRAACRHNADQVLYKLFLAAAMPYLRMMWDWSFSASTVRDGRGDFFGTVLGLEANGPELRLFPSKETGESSEIPCDKREYPCFLSQATAQRILRSGRARALLAGFDPDNRLLQVTPPVVDSVLDESVSIEGLRDLQGRLDRYVAIVQQAPGKIGVSIENIDGPTPHKLISLEHLNAVISNAVTTHESRETDLGHGSSDSVTHYASQYDTDVPDVIRDEFSIDRSLFGTSCDLKFNSGRSHRSVFGFPAEECKDFETKRITANFFFGSFKGNCPVAVDKSYAKDQTSQHSPIQFCYERWWPPLPSLLESVAVAPIDRVDSFVQRDVLHYFVNELKVQSHLDALWKYVLLGAGNFADALVLCIDGRISAAEVITVDVAHNDILTEHDTFVRSSSGPSGLASRQRAHLAACLQNALSISGGDTDPLTCRLSLDVDLVVIEATEGDATDAFQSSVQSGPDVSSPPSIWDRNIKIEYKAEFPLSFVISPEIVDQCSVFFNFFLRVRRAENCLRRLFMTFRRQSSLRAHSRNPEALLEDGHLCTRVWRFSWEAEHFVRIVGGYEATQVLNLSWSALRSGGSWRQHELDQGGNIWKLREAVFQFLDESARRALLDDKHRNVMRVIVGALDEIVRVEGLLLSGADPNVRHSRSKLNWFVAEVNKASESLLRRSRFLVDILKKLVSTGASESQPHLVDLLDRLNYNKFYEDQ